MSGLAVRYVKIAAGVPDESGPSRWAGRGRLRGCQVSVVRHLKATCITGRTRLKQYVVDYSGCPQAPPSLLTRILVARCPCGLVIGVAELHYATGRTAQQSRPSEGQYRRFLTNRCARLRHSFRSRSFSIESRLTARERSRYRSGRGMGLEAVLERSSTTLGAEADDPCQAAIANRTHLANCAAQGIPKSLERFGRSRSHQGFPGTCSTPHRGSPSRWIASLLHSTRAVFILAMFSLPGEPDSIDVEADLRETARHINKSTPRPIGNIAVLEGAEAHERTLKYKFRLKELSKEEVSPESGSSRHDVAARVIGDRALRHGSSDTAGP